jgi:hypothetical protein
MGKGDGTFRRCGRRTPRELKRGWVSDGKFPKPEGSVSLLHRQMLNKLDLNKTKFVRVRRKAPFGHNNPVILDSDVGCGFHELMNRSGAESNSFLCESIQQ